METHRMTRTFTAILCLGLLFWSGCANFLKPEIGAVARKEARIVLVESGVKDKVLATSHLKILYSLSGKGEHFSLSGRVIFDQSVTYSFPIIARFFLKMNFLDSEGRVIETVDITPMYTAFGSVPEKLDFRTSHAAPPGSSAIAFNYFGVFQSTTPEMNGSWDIFYLPFD
jgi:hypothetical protein